MQAHFETYDAIILVDELQYTHPGEQKLLLEKCINNLYPAGVLIIRVGNTGRDSEFCISPGLLIDLAAANNMICEEIRREKSMPGSVFILRQKGLN